VQVPEGRASAYANQHLSSKRGSGQRDAALSVDRHNRVSAARRVPLAGATKAQEGAPVDPAQPSQMLRERGCDARHAIARVN
jgi:hypothetical protein